MTAATPTPAPPGSAAYAHERPSLERGEGKADIVVRLQARLDWWRDSPETPNEADDLLSADMDITFAPDMADAIVTIKGLRESDQRRLQLINQAKGERDEARARVAELEAMLRKIVAADDAAIAELEKLGLPPGETTRGITEEARALLAAKPHEQIEAAP